MSCSCSCIAIARRLMHVAKVVRVDDPLPHLACAVPRRAAPRIVFAVVPLNRSPLRPLARRSADRVDAPRPTAGLLRGWAAGAGRPAKPAESQEVELRDV